MKGKQFAILLVLGILIGGAGWYLFQGGQSSWSSAGGGAGRKVFDLPLNDVARFSIKTADGEVHLVKKGNDWTVEERAGYPAAFTQVSDLLRKLWDLKTVQDVKVGPSQMARLNLVEPGKGDKAGTAMVFEDKDGKKLASLLIGKKYLKKGVDAGFGNSEGVPAGRYVMPLDGGDVSLVSDALDEINTKPESWLNHDFIKIENPVSVTLEGTTPETHWKLARENATAPWTLAEAKPEEKVDASKTTPISTLVANASFNDVLAPEAKPADTGLDKPAVLKYSAADHFDYVLKIGKASGENYPVTVEVSAAIEKERKPGKDEKPEDKTKLDQEFQTKLKQLEDKLASEKKFEGRPYLIAKGTIDQLIKPRTALLEEKKPEPPVTTPAIPGPTSVTTPPVSMPGLPPGLHRPPTVVIPPVAAPAPPGPVTVTTPPVAVPPAHGPVTVTTPPLTAPMPAAPTTPPAAPAPPVTASPTVAPAPASGTTVPPAAPVIPATAPAPAPSTAAPAPSTPAVPVTPPPAAPMPAAPAPVAPVTPAAPPATPVPTEPAPAPTPATVPSAAPAPAPAPAAPLIPAPPTAPSPAPESAPAPATPAAPATPIPALAPVPPPSPAPSNPPAPAPAAEPAPATPAPAAPTPTQPPVAPNPPATSEPAPAATPAGAPAPAAPPANEPAEPAK